MVPTFCLLLHSCKLQCSALHTAATSALKTSSCSTQDAYLRSAPFPNQKVLLQVVSDPSDADFILCHGTEALGQPGRAEAQALSLDSIKDVLKVCAEQAAPPAMVVANPDVVTVSGSSLIPMPGTLAEYYESLGGQVKAELPERGSMHMQACFVQASSCK